MFELTIDCGDRPEAQIFKIDNNTELLHGFLSLRLELHYTPDRLDAVETVSYKVAINATNL